MPQKPRQVFAFSGVLQAAAGQRDSFTLAEYALSLAAGTGRKRVCYLPTAIGDLEAAVTAKAELFAARTGAEFTALRLFPQPTYADPRAHLLSQDLILVEGGSVVNLMALWRAHGLRQIMAECWAAGVVLAGASAGSLCWHQGGPTDSYRDALDPFTDGLGLIPASNGVHDDFPEQPRRQVYRRMIADGALPSGYASEDGVGLHYVGTDLHEAVSIVPGKRAWRVTRDPVGGYLDEPVEARLI